MDAVTPEARLPLVEMAVPALCRLSGVQYLKLCETVDRLIEADEKVSLFEFALRQVLKRQLAGHFARRPRARAPQASQIQEATATILSALAHTGTVPVSSVERAFAAGAEELAPAIGGIALADRAQCQIEDVGRALDRLAAAPPPIKKAVIEACAACIGFDGRITIEEGELLRAIAASLDCPMPPLLASHE
jgi:hypothetical protein